MLHLLRDVLRLLVLTCLVGTILPCYAAGSESDAVPENVSYQSITALPWREADHRLAYGSDSLQFGELWLPKSADKTNPAALVIFIHGGCWLSAYDITHSYPLSTALSEQGMAVWSIEYRRHGDDGGGWPGSLEDILSGIRHINALTSYAVDLQRVVLSGHSAGGHLALLAAQQPDMPPLQGVLGLAAITNIARYGKGENGCQKAAVSFMGGSPEDIPHAYQQAAIDADRIGAPVHLLHGDADSIVPVHSHKDFLQTRLLTSGHFDWLHPGTQAYALFTHKLKSFLEDENDPDGGI
ncbi:alpha/beta hydrolase [Lacimicrobium sp. SS2-24]|uniref:alpha/beta hydrolase n=1 Tax=Lacimicrobium sp. SS2-24 TaxID=2005569 RepID=UPI000B4AB4A2|nr:alpha/beta hydrolase [Lacimicrobium sp. SS2-24]